MYIQITKTNKKRNIMLKDLLTAVFGRTFDAETMSLLNGIKDVITEMAPAFPLSMESPFFTDEDDHYSVVIGVADGADDSDINVELIDSTTLRVQYHVNKEYTKMFKGVEVALPEDADADTVDAIIDENTLTVTVKKHKPEPEKKAPRRIKVKK